MGKGDRTGHCTQLTLNIRPEVPSISAWSFHWGPVSSIFYPSRFGKWNLEQKSKQNYGFWVPVVWNWVAPLWYGNRYFCWVPYVISPSILLCKMGMMVILTTRGLQWGFNETKYDQWLAFCLAFGKGSENINYMSYCYGKLFMDTLRIWQKKAKLGNKVGLHFLQERSQI